MPPRRRSPPDALGRLFAGLARQLDLPFLGARPTTHDTPESTPPQRRPRAPSPDIAVRTIRLSDVSLDYTLRRARRKTIGFSIAAGGLTVAAPRWVGVRRVEDAIRERERWVLAKLDEIRRRQAAIPQVAWVDGGTVPYRGEPLTLRVVHATTARVPAPVLVPDARTLTVTIGPAAPASAVRDRVTAWLQAEAREVFEERLALHEVRLGVRHRALRLSSARTRWGSCSADGRILLNWRLVHLPPAAIDYVVVHELAHLKEMNHGPRFWATVAAALPDFEIGHALVKNPPPALMPTL